MTTRARTLVPDQNPNSRHKGTGAAYLLLVSIISITWHLSLMDKAQMMMIELSIWGGGLFMSSIFLHPKLHKRNYVSVLNILS